MELRSWVILLYLLVPPYTVASPPPYTDEPPPYTPSALYNTDPTIVCRVCQQLIPIRGRENQRVIKCSNCQEATVSTCDIIIITTEIGLHLLKQNTHVVMLTL